MRTRDQALAMLLLAGPGCPAHDDDDGAGDETGITPEADPLDPFDGEGGDPPGDPDRNLTYRSPTSLGNGLVHDSRFDLHVGEYKLHTSGAQLAAGVDWASFVTPHADKLRVGFRPAQVEAHVYVE